MPDAEYREEREGPRDVRVTANDFHRRRLGLGPFRPREDGVNCETAGNGVQVTIGTQTGRVR
ncbi:hypothetical protein AB0D91_46190 [Streptomyces canus]|uniref:hypothetical protein n=1 Tax=Streptomyces canus TaxID=58343 RepID=UPI0033E2B19F